MAIGHLGTEQYKNGRYGIQKVSYYLDGSVIEERRHRPSQNDYVVTRYLDFQSDEIGSASAMIASVDGVQAKSAKKHDEINRLLNRKPSVTAYVDADEIDSPNRNAIVCTSCNMGFVNNPDEYKRYFVINSN